MNRRHRGAAQLREFLEHGLPAPDGIVHRAFAVKFLKFLQVRAGDKAAGFTRGNHQRFGQLQRDALQHIAQLDQRVLRERIDGSVRTVEVQHQHAIVAELGFPVAQR